MKRVYKNGTIYVVGDYDRKNIIKATEIFLKKVISEEVKNANSDTSKNFREK